MEIRKVSSVVGKHGMGDIGILYMDTERQDVEPVRMFFFAELRTFLVKNGL